MTGLSLLEGVRPDGAPLPLEEHLSLYGPAPPIRRGRGAGLELIELVEESGLRGRGGAGFPTSVKLRAVVQSGRRTVAVANGAEGEPLSRKDKALLRALPHLVLDGAALAARAVGAEEAIVAVGAGAVRERAVVAAAIAERRRSRLDGAVLLREISVPDAFVAGEETALVQWLNGGAAKPTFTPPRPFERGVGGRPTLVQNVETLAHLALIARYGPDWFRSFGTQEEPGSVLVTLAGAFRRPGVYEFDLGTGFRDLISVAGGLTGAPQAFLVGGYYGSWLAPDDLLGLSLLEADLTTADSSLGARTIFALPAGVCGFVEAAIVTRYLAAQSAGQCGPCVHGLAAIARTVASLTRGERNPGGRERLSRWLEEVNGRGACRYPDGAARFVESALRVFSEEIDLHLRHRRCSGSRARLLPAPAMAAQASGRR